jgi:hypothetical protein
MGALAYVMITYKIPAYMQAMPEDLQFWLDQRPVWFTSVWVISVWSALFGSFLLLLRHRPALGHFVLSLVSFLIVVLWAYLSEAANLAHIQSTITHIFNVLIIFTHIFYNFLPAIHTNWCFALGGTGQSGAIGLTDAAYSAWAGGASPMCGC